MLGGLDRKTKKAFIQDLSDGVPRHLPWDWGGDVLPSSTLDRLRATRRLFEVDFQLSTCVCDCTDMQTLVGLEILANDLQTGKRSKAHRTLAQAAEWSPEAADVLIADATARKEVVEADRWTAKRAEVASFLTGAPFRQAPPTTGTGYGVGVVFPMD